MNRITLRPLLSFTLSCFLLGACVGDEGVGKSEAALAHAGPWDIPADTLAIGDSQSVTYTGAGPWTGSSGCHGSLSSGAGALRDWLRAAYPQISSIGGYSCRAINGDSSTMSVHATGRALDIHIPLHGGEADNDLGDPIANWLIEHAQEIGIQYIIWDRWTWGAHRTPGAKERSYGGAHPHHDHLHVELSVQAGRMGTPWFSGPMTLPDSDCPSLGADGGVVEETSDCFAAYGPAAYWRQEGVGHGGQLRWTNAFASDSPSNWARWMLRPSAAGEYRVEVYAQPEFSVHRAARYAVRHAGAEHELEVDLSGASGWVELGTFMFDDGGGQHLSLYDHSRVAVPADQHIPADAVRLVRADLVEPDPDPDPDPTPGPRTIEIWEGVYAEARPLEGGDPRIDDDAMRPDLMSGCSVGSAPGPAPRWLLALPLAALALRRRRR